jgi:nucleoside-diphosphate-sugar epimerase
MEKEKPGFALVTIHPSLVYGYNPIQQSAKELEGSSNGLFFGSIMNGAFSDAPLLSVYIGDVADSHIRALDPKIKSGSSYLISGKPYTWKDVVETIQKYHPGVPFKVAPNAEPKVAKTDTSKAERELGIKWAEPEKMIKEVLDQQLAYFK